MFHADPSHSGAGTGNSVLTPTLLWNYTTGGYVESSPAVVGGVVYVGGGNNVYALNAANGAKLWSYTTGNMVWSSPAVVNDVVYIGSNDDHVYALNATSGIQLWNYTTGSTVESSPAAVNGVVYIGSDNGNVYAFGTLPASSNTSSITIGVIIGVAVAAVIVAKALFLMFRKRLKIKPTYFSDSFRAEK